MLKEIKKIETTVREVLRDFPASRDNDKKLILAVWARQGLLLTAEQKDAFFKCSPAESIRRVRQKIQESGEYPSYRKVRQGRLLEEENVRQHYADH